MNYMIITSSEMIVYLKLESELVKKEVNSINLLYICIFIIIVTK